MTIKRGVSFYSYQQSQFFKELMLEDQMAELGSIPGADGIEMIDEMSLQYPTPSKEFERHWFSMVEQHNLVPVALDVGMDVLQYRDHVMSHEECAERLRRDIRLAKRLGFSVVRVLSATPLDVMIRALPVAEELDIRLGKEIHQPMTLEGQQVAEILDYVQKHDCEHLGIVPDMGIFQYRPSEALLKWFSRRGTQASANAAATQLSELIHSGEAGEAFDLSNMTAGNVRSDFLRYLKKGEAPEECKAAFEGVADFAKKNIDNPSEVDFLVVAEALTFSRTSAQTLREIAKNVVCVHGKFYEMSKTESGFVDASIDYESAMKALVEGGFSGYVNSEYEGQRYYQDRTRADLMSEVEQVRMHQQMLSALLD